MSQFLASEHLTPKEYITGYLTPYVHPVWGTSAEREYHWYHASKRAYNKNEAWRGIHLGCKSLPFLFPSILFLFTLFTY